MKHIFCRGTCIVFFFLMKLYIREFCEFKIYFYLFSCYFPITVLFLSANLVFITKDRYLIPKNQVTLIWMERFCYRYTPCRCCNTLMHCSNFWNISSILEFLHLLSCAACHHTVITFIPQIAKALTSYLSGNNIPKNKAFQNWKSCHKQTVDQTKFILFSKNQVFDIYMHGFESSANVFVHQSIFPGQVHVPLTCFKPKISVVKYYLSFSCMV